MISSGATEPLGLSSSAAGAATSSMSSASSGSVVVAVVRARSVVLELDGAVVVLVTLESLALASVVEGAAGRVVVVVGAGAALEVGGGGAVVDDVGGAGVGAAVVGGTDVAGASTTTRPVCPWNVQTYEKVPPWSKTRVVDWPRPSSRSNPSSNVTVWLTRSTLLHRTESPTWILTSPGWYWKFSIVTRCSTAAAGPMTRSASEATTAGTAFRIGALWRSQRRDGAADQIASGALDATV
jgi:hypothetical protein